MGYHFRKIMYSILVIALFIMSTCLRIDAEGEGLVIEGGTEGKDYTYADGVLTILKNGSYSISMASGVDETSDRIVLYAGELTELTLTLNDLNLKTEERTNLKFDNYPGLENIKMTLILNGDNTFSAAVRPIECERNIPETTVKGDGSLTLTVTGSNPDSNGWNNRNFTLESGNVTFNNTSLTAHESITIDDGTLTINDAPANASSAIYTNGSYTQNDGTVTINSAKCHGIFVPGVNESSNPGVQILGGTLKIETPLYGIIASHPNDEERGQKDVIIKTDENVSIKAYIGILLANGSDLTMNQGTLQIEGGPIGIYAYSDASNFNVNGGETEITTVDAVNSQGDTITARAIDLHLAEQKTISFSQDYFHKDYDGTDLGSREETTDEALIKENDKSDKYVLITPAYRITYDLGEGSLPDDQSNPEKYSRVDEIILKNPIPNGDAQFLGWSGTDLDGITETVTIAEGSTGDREYKANYQVNEYSITYELDGGNIDGNAGPLVYTYPSGTAITILKAPEKKGYEFQYWKTSDSSYDPNDDYIVKGNVTFTAVWKEKAAPETPDNTDVEIPFVFPHTGVDGQGMDQVIIKTRHSRCLVY